MCVQIPKCLSDFSLIKYVCPKFICRRVTFFVCFCFVLLSVNQDGYIREKHRREKKKRRERREGGGGGGGVQDELIIHRYKSQPGLIPACEVTSAPQREHKKLVVLFGFPPAMMAA